MRDNERGSALVIALFLVTVLALLGMGVITTALMDLRISDSYVRSLEAFYAADAGLNEAVAMLQDDPTLGDIAPNPAGAPLFQKVHGRGDYSIWIWNKRVRGSGQVEDFPIPGSRQVVVLGSDGRDATRRVEAIVTPSRRRPEALNYVTFSCGSTFMTGANGGDIEGSMYSGGNLSWAGKTPDYVNAEVYGNFTGTKNLKNGWLKANGNVVNADCKVSLTCKVGGTISNPGKCLGGATSLMAPLPVKEYCNQASPDWNPLMLDLTQDEIQDYRDETLLANQHATGWTVDGGGGTMVLAERVWVYGGDATFRDVKVEFTGDTILLVDGNFICDECEIKKGPKGSNLTIITSSGDITFTGDEKSTYFGVLWAGVWSALGPPAAGSILIDTDYEIKLKGSMVATVGSVTNLGRSHVYEEPGKPVHFGEVTGFAISEWLETR